MKRYEGLFILNTAGKEEGVKEVIDKITAEIDKNGGKVETVQKMDRRAFSRVTKKNMTSGFYVNFIFECKPEGIALLRSRFALSEDVYRVLFSEASATPAPQPVAA